MKRIFIAILLCKFLFLSGLPATPALAQSADLSRESVNRVQFHQSNDFTDGQSALVLKTQVLLDRANASPGVIDGHYGENVAKAISAFEAVNGLEVDGMLDQEVWAALDGDKPTDVLVEHEITEADLDHEFVERIPQDYAEMAKMEYLGFTSPEEMLAERFHMDIDLLKQLNIGAAFSVGETIIVAGIGESPPKGKVTRVEADKGKAQVRAYGDAGNLIVAYPATVGSAENPSPSGVHQVAAVAHDPVYYYRPGENFQQGDNTEPLDIPPGPNNPVGTVWIDLSKPGYGIHGTPEPSEIDKTASHGCVRLTNWDAQELASLVQSGTLVEFVK